MKLTSMTTTSGRAGRRLPSKRADIGLFHRHDLGMVVQRGMQLAAADVDRKHQAGAVRQQHLGKAAGRRADVEADMVLDVDRILLQRARQLDAAARHIGMRGLRGQCGVGGDDFGGFCHRLAVGQTTSPASIAARARARLSNRPRSTSSTSARLRGARVRSRLFVKALNPICRAPRSAARRTQASNEVRSCQISAGAIRRRHQWAAMQVERVDHHEIVGQSKILHGKSLRVDQAAIGRGFHVI